MSFLKNLFGPVPKPRTLLDDTQEVGNKLIVKGYRRIAAQHGCAPTAKTTDKKIIEIYTLVSKVFHQAAERRGEHIPALFQNCIVLKFLKVYELAGDHLQHHLQYEVDKYLAEGLRPDYKQELRLFDPDGNDPDVKRLRELHELAREKLGKEFVPKQNKPPSLSNDKKEISYSRIAAIIRMSAILTADRCAEIGHKRNKAHFQLALAEFLAFLTYIACNEICVKLNQKGVEIHLESICKAFTNFSETLLPVSPEHQLLVSAITNHRTLNFKAHFQGYWNGDLESLGITQELIDEVGNEILGGIKRASNSQAANAHFALLVRNCLLDNASHIFPPAFIVVGYDKIIREEGEEFHKTAKSGT